MASGPFSSMTLMQATITFIVAFFAVNVLIDVVMNRDITLAQHIVVSLLAAPLWYFFIRWMRSRNA